jgi:hypothetical protein
MCVDDWCRKAWASEVFANPIRIDVSNGGEVYPSAFRLQGYAAPTLADLKIKLEQFPAGTTFRWCPQPFDAYTPGQHQEIVDNSSVFVSRHSMTIEPYSAEKCVPGGTH